MFYRRVLTQYFAFTTRTPKWVGTVLSMDALKELAASDQDIAEDIRNMEDTLEREPTAAWPFAQEVAHRISQWKDVRILQILDLCGVPGYVESTPEDPKSKRNRRASTPHNSAMATPLQRLEPVEDRGIGPP